MWKFGQGKNKAVESVTEIVSSIEGLGNRMGTLEERLQKDEEERESRENKLLRMQYKTTQEILENLEGLKDTLGKTLHAQESLVVAEEEKGLMFDCLLNILDDLDLVMDKMHNQEDNPWQNLFLSWSKSIIETLRMLKIYEIPLLGKEFNPFYAEALGTMGKEDAGEGAFPCQVVKVYRRGFYFADGSLIRKARVLTVEEAADPLPPSRDDQAPTPSPSPAPSPSPNVPFTPGVLPQKEDSRSLRRNRLSNLRGKKGVKLCMRKRRILSFFEAKEKRKAQKGFR